MLEKSEILTYLRSFKTLLRILIEVIQHEKNFFTMYIKNNSVKYFYECYCVIMGILMVILSLHFPSITIVSSFNVKNHLERRDQQIYNLHALS